MNKPVYLGLSILEISKTLMYGFSYNYIKPKYQWNCIQQNAKLCYMDTDNFIINIKTEDFYKDIADDAKKDLIHKIMKLIDHYQKEKNKKVTGLMKDELGGKIMTEFVALRPKTYSYLMDDANTEKKVKGTKKSVIKRIPKINDY